MKLKLKVSFYAPFSYCLWPGQLLVYIASNFLVLVPPNLVLALGDLKKQGYRSIHTDFSFTSDTKISHLAE